MDDPHLAHTPGCKAGDIDGECPCEQRSGMSLIERWERLAVLSWDRHGMPQTVRALTPGGMALRDGETEYVRADLHAGAVERAEKAERLVALYRENGSADLTRLVEYEAKIAAERGQ